MNTALMYLICSLNHFKFSTLPPPLENYLYYAYAPQDTMRGGNVKIGAEIDLSSEYSVWKNITTYRWYDGETEIPANQYTAANGKFTFTDPSLNGKTLICQMTNPIFPDFDAFPLIYKVKLTDEVGIEENNENIFINLYPNPSNNILTINNSNGIIKNISLFDISGKLLNSYNNIDNPSYSIDISTYPAGTYMLDIDGKVVKFVKE